MAHAFAPDLRDGDFDAALFADDSLVFHALVLAAQAFVILDRAEDAGAEQAVTLGLERAVVDRLRLLDLAERPAADLVGRRDADADLVEGLRLGDRIGEGGQFVHSLAPDPSREGEGLVGSCDYSAARAVGSSGSSATLSSSTLRPSERISLTSTLKLSGMPASNVSSPLTIAS